MFVKISNSIEKILYLIHFFNLKDTVYICKSLCLPLSFSSDPEILKKKKKTKQRARCVTSFDLIINSDLLGSLEFYTMSLARKKIQKGMTKKKAQKRVRR